MPQKFVVRQTGKFCGKIRPPSDKSLTHRAYMFAAIASSGISTIKEPLSGEDCESTLRILEQLGANVNRISEREVQISAIQQWNTEALTLDCGNSGTTMRLMCGILAGVPGVNVTLVGDESLSRRPMGRITTPLQLMGGDITGDSAPIRLKGQNLKGIDYTSPVASAQIKSAILLGGINAKGKTSVTEPAHSRDHTERMFKSLGVDVTSEGTKVSLMGKQSWDAFNFTVPGDISSAAFFIVSALIHPDSQVEFEELGVNPSRTGILELLTQMFERKSPVRLSDLNNQLGEPISSLTVNSPSHLPPFLIEGDAVPILIDEIPVLAVLATQCNGQTIIRDAQELRVKETDRIEVVTRYLKAMGANITATSDGMVINGPTPLHGTVVDSSGDHRIGMSFAIAGSVASGETIIENADSINTSYPRFLDHFEHLTGSKIEVIN